MAGKSQTKNGPKSEGTKLDSYLPWILLIAGLIALLASLMLSIEVFDRLKNPKLVPICNLSPVLSCTSVADSPQSHAFGFPNYFIGIAAYAALAMIGLAMLAGAKFKIWFWRLIEAGLFFSVLFITWLQFQSLYRIGALCIFCMIVWAATIPIFWYTTLYAFRIGALPKPAKATRAINFAQRHHLDILTVWYLLIILLILKRFWYYWSTLV